MKNQKPNIMEQLTNQKKLENSDQAFRYECTTPHVK